MQPVIVLGMHRSGTSAVARALDRLGLFVGDDLQDDHESRLFIALNEHVFAQAGASWDQPRAVARLLDDAAACDRLAARLRGALNQQAAGRFLGRGRGWVDLTARPWGWKDPRNTFTLPVWLTLWPRATVLHVTRNGIDVAGSLKTRHAQVVQRYTQHHGTPPPAPVFHLGQVPFTHRSAELAGGLALWREHLANVARLRRKHGIEVAEVRYEALIERPQEILPWLAGVAGLRPTAEQFDAAAGLLAGARPVRFPEDPELRAFAKSLRPADLPGYARLVAGRLERSGAMG